MASRSSRCWFAVIGYPMPSAELLSSSVGSAPFNFCLFPTKCILEISSVRLYTTVCKGISKLIDCKRHWEKHVHARLMHLREGEGTHV